MHAFFLSCGKTHFLAINVCCTRYAVGFSRLNLGLCLSGASSGGRGLGFGAVRTDGVSPGFVPDLHDASADWSFMGDAGMLRLRNRYVRSDFNILDHFPVKRRCRVVSISGL